MDRTREGAGGALTTLKSAIATAEAEEGVDGAMLQEAKTLLATKPLQTAMEQREVAGLSVAIEVAEGNADVDRAIVEVSECAHAGTRTVHARITCRIRGGIFSWKKNIREIREIFHTPNSIRIL